MRCLNRVMLIGRVGRGFKIDTSDKGLKYVKFVLETESSWTDKAGNTKGSFEYHKISLFGPLTDVFEKNVRVGTVLYVEGSLKTNSWKDKNGLEKKETSINAGNMIIMSNASDGDSNKQSEVEKMPAISLYPKPSINDAMSYHVKTQAEEFLIDDNIPF